MEIFLIYILIGCVYVVIRKAHIYGLYKQVFDIAGTFIKEIPAVVHKVIAFIIPSVFLFAWPLFILSQIKAYIKRP